MNRLPDNVANAVLPLGLPQASLGPFIGALTTHNTAVLFTIPDVTPRIAGAGADALLGTYSTGFNHVWIAASCFVAIATICKVTWPVVSAESLLTGKTAACFLKERTKEFNMHIDAPVEKEEDLYSLQDVRS